MTHLFHVIACLMIVMAVSRSTTAQYSVSLPLKEVTVDNVNDDAIFKGAYCIGEPGNRCCLFTGYRFFCRLKLRLKI